MRLRPWLVIPLFVTASLALAPSCAAYDPPPKPTLDVSTDGVLDDPRAPVVVHFTVPVAPDSLRVKIARYVTDIEGNLPDELPDPQPLETYFVHDPDDGDAKGKSTLSGDGKTLTIVPSSALPTGPRLVLIFEPGLSDPAGHATHVRKKLLFGYRLKLDCNQPVKNLASGDFFFLVAVQDPIKTQIRMFATIDIDPNTGRFVGQWTRAMRNPSPSHCPAGLTCKSTECCRTLPMDACVIPSEPAGSVDEFPDHVPDLSTATGFSFTAQGCIVDQSDGSAALVNAPVDVEVTSPQVTLRNTVLSAAFKADATGVVRGTGSLTADEVFLGDISSGKGTGDLTARTIPAGQSPPGIPAPPAASSSSTTP